MPTGPDRLLLSPDELVELTGYSRPSRQRDWLSERGFVYALGGDGRIKVARAHAMQRLGAADVKGAGPRLRL